MNVNRINTTYRKLSETDSSDGGGESPSVSVPQKLSEQVDSINRDWITVHKLADQLGPHDDDEVNEVMAQG